MGKSIIVATITSSSLVAPLKKCINLTLPTHVDSNLTWTTFIAFTSYGNCELH